MLVLEKTPGFMDFSSMIGMNRVGPTAMFASLKDYSVFHRRVYLSHYLRGYLHVLPYYSFFPQTLPSRKILKNPVECGPNYFQPS